MKNGSREGCKKKCPNVALRCFHLNVDGRGIRVYNISYTEK